MNKTWVKSATPGLQRQNSTSQDAHYPGQQEKLTLYWMSSLMKMGTNGFKSATTLKNAINLVITVCETELQPPPDKIAWTGIKDCNGI